MRRWKCGFPVDDRVFKKMCVGYFFFVFGGKGKAVDEGKRPKKIIDWKNKSFLQECAVVITLADYSFN